MQRFPKERFWEWRDPDDFILSLNRAFRYSTSDLERLFYKYQRYQLINPPTIQRIK